MEKYIMAIDQGTTGSRAILFSRQGQVVSTAYQEFKQYYPQPGWVEHDPEEIWQSVVMVIEEACRKPNISFVQLEAIGITNQRETCLIWDRKTGKPIHKAIVWQCRRTAPLCDRLKEQGYATLIQQKTGLVIDAYFSGTKIKWLLDNVPGTRERAAAGELACGTIDTWLVWKLTGGQVHVTDHTNASRTMLYNIHHLQWDQEILDIVGIPASLLPAVQDSSSAFGRTDSEGILNQDIPITGIAGDQQAALCGQGCFSRGEVKNTYGTGCFLMINTGRQAEISTHGLLTTIACNHLGKPVYALEGSVFIAGAAVQWLRDELQIIKTASETEAVAQSIDSTEGLYLVPAFVGLGAPYWDMDARGIMVGITRGTGRKHMIRASLESIAYQTYDLVASIQKDIDITLKILKVDGGACKNDFLMQFQADILNIPVERAVIVESTALGAAFLAGLHTGFWKDHHQFNSFLKTDKVFSPAMDDERRQSLLQGWKNAVQKVLTTS
ncbi:glycerol kinase GlpK [candidate division CSSED10-310 bacterium]|uniref:Glycerol kinase n=1 Tax=candidate division CSSED10-310 bacterium TaxID=2855610 RepID=A0ABV6YRB2_UNCC1